ncbi:MAG: RNase P subunit p30 family protein [archaeon]
MNLNLVQFWEPEILGHYAPEFKDEAIIVCSDFTEAELKEFSQKKRKCSTKFFSCKLLARKDNNEMQRFRRLADFVAVQGSSPEMCFWAGTQKADLLVQPFSSQKNFLDSQTITVLKQNNVFAAFLFSDFLAARSFEQSQLLKNAMLSLKLLDKGGAKTLFFSGARNEQELRAAKDLSSFAVFLGMKKDSALKAARKSTEEFLERVK